MPGGNTSSTKWGLKAIKGTSQLAPDVKHQATVEVFANPSNLGIDAPHGPDYEIDVNYGLAMDGSIHHNIEDTQGATGWNDVNPGPAHIINRKLAGSKDPQPGGCF